MADARTRSDLDDFAKPTLAVDIALLTVLGHGTPHLAVVLQRPSGGVGGHGTGDWGLPGSFVRHPERVRAAVTRTLLSKTGMRDVATRPLGIFDAPDRDPRGWVVSAGHVATVTPQVVEEVAPTRHDVAVVPVVEDDDGVRAELPGGQRALPYDHQLILEAAVADIRERYDREPDPDGLLGPTFTLRQLRQVHQAVEGRAPHEDTFNRQVLEVLEKTEETLQGPTGRPAALYRRRTSAGGRPMSLRASGRVASPPSR